jgi:hypothetical protein
LGEPGEEVCRFFLHIVEGMSTLPFFHEQKVDAYVDTDVALMVKEVSAFDS